MIILDQITKYLTVENIAYNTRGIEILPFFNLVHVYNYGAAFSMFASWGGAQRYLLSGIAIVMTLVFLVVLLRTKATAKWHCVSYALFIGGAVGNLIDRLMHSDGNITWAYPAFNVADIAVVCGAVLMVILAIFTKEPKK